MAARRLELPVLQNWNCHNCGGCCRQHLIEITEAERQRILDQHWTAADGVETTQVVVRMNGWFGRPRYRLAHQSDGACVFLDERGLCRIHAKFGEAAKPLACLVYPYAFHPAGKSVAVSLRFSCPSVVMNAGRPVSQQQTEIRRIAEAVVPAGHATIPPPRVNSFGRVDWPDFHRFVEALDQTLSEPDTPQVVRLLRANIWTSLVGQSTFEKLKGDRIRDFLGLIQEAARVEVPSVPENPTEPTPIGRLYFRLLVAQYARKDTAADLDAGWYGRWRLLKAVWRFSRGRGDVPPLQELFRPVPFAALEGSFGGLTPEQDEIFTRYFRVKVQGLHFCGPAFYGVPFVEGFQSLMLMLPATLWLARWLAVGAGRTSLTTDDVVRALAVADHHHGFSPALGQHAARRRVRLLGDAGDLPRLVAWYAR
jgi:lysine-N-methylase